MNEYNRGEMVDERLDTVNREISDYKSAISDSKRECMRLLDDSLNIGSATLAELNTQGERLDTISNNLRQIEASIYKAEKTVTKMEWRDKHPILSFFIGKHVKKPKWFGRGEGSETPTTDDSALSVRGMHNTHGAGDEDSKFVDTVQSKVNILKNMALDMGSELDKQNIKLGEIIEHTVHVTEHVDKTRYRVGKLTVE